MWFFGQIKAQKKVGKIKKSTEICEQIFIWPGMLKRERNKEREREKRERGKNEDNQLTRDRKQAKGNANEQSWGAQKNICWRPGRPTSFETEKKWKQAPSAFQ